MICNIQGLRPLTDPRSRRPGFLRFQHFSLVEDVGQLLPIGFGLEPLQIVHELRIKPDQDARVVVLDALDDALRSPGRRGPRGAVETLERFGATRIRWKTSARTGVTRDVGYNSTGMDQCKLDGASCGFKLVAQALRKPAHREFLARQWAVWPGGAQMLKMLDTFTNVGLTLLRQVRQERTRGMYDAPGEQLTFISQSICSWSIS